MLELDVDESLTIEAACNCEFGFIDSGVERGEFKKDKSLCLPTNEVLEDFSLR